MYAYIVDGMYFLLLSVVTYTVVCVACSIDGCMQRSNNRSGGIKESHTLTSMVYLKLFLDQR